MRKELESVLPYYSYDKEVIDLSANENHYSNWLDIVKVSELDNNLLLAQYGPDFHTELNKKYAKIIGVDHHCIITTPGSEPFLSVLINALSSKTMISLKQDFFRYDEVALILKRKSYLVDYQPGYIDEIINQINQHNIELLIISNPNNPLGIKHNEEDLLKILDNTNAYIVIDEAYHEYQKDTMIKYLDKYPKLVIMRTLSKAWGLAGLRTAFIISNPKLIQYLYAIQGPFTLSIINANIAKNILDYPHVMKKMVTKTLNVKDKFIDELSKSDIYPAYPSHTNFVYLENDKAEAIKQALYENDAIAISYFKPNGLRVTIGTEAEMIKVAQLLKKYWRF